MNKLPAFMATGTDLIVASHIIQGLLAKREGRFWALFFAFGLIDVRFAVAVATDTIGQSAIRMSAVTSFSNTENRVAFVLIVAFCAL